MLSSSWNDYGVGEIGPTIAVITQKNPRAKVVVVGSKSQSRSSIDSLLISRWSGSSPETTAYAGRTHSMDMLNSRILAASREATFIDINRHVCDSDAQRCTVLADDGALMFSDAVHLTRSGAASLHRGLEQSGELKLFD